MGTNHEFQGLGLAKNVMRYLAFHSGPWATGPFEVGAFLRTAPEVAYPDLQFYLAAISLAPKDDDFPAPVGKLDASPGVTIAGSLMRLTSEGTVQIASQDPGAPPSISPNWLATAEDRRAVVRMVGQIRRYMSQPATAPMLGGELSVSANYRSDDEIEGWVRRAATSSLHAVGSCRMGGDNGAVVDERLKVRGVQGLRVVDCSIIPGLISGNTNGPAMAVAWRAADLILQEARS
jgi:choline dehydrogenase-like flavoprotein